MQVLTEYRSIITKLISVVGCVIVVMLVSANPNGVFQLILGGVAGLSLDYIFHRLLLDKSDTTGR